MGDTYEIPLGVQGTGAVESAADVVERLAQNLATANDAVKASQAAYDAAQNAANRAAKALEGINQQLGVQAIKMRDALVAGDTGAVQRAALAMQKLTAAQAAAAQKAQELGAAVLVAAGDLDAAKAAAKGAEEAVKKNADAMGSGKVNEAAEAFGRLGGPLGMAGQKAFATADGIKKLYASLGSNAAPAIAAIGLAAVAAVVIAIGVAAVVSAVKIAAWAVGLADANRSARLLADGVAGSVAAGGKLNDEIDRLQGVVPLTRDELLGMAGDLKKAGKSGDEIANSLEEVATKAAQLKFGPNFAKQLLSLDSQAARFKRNLGGVFGGLNIEPVLEGMAKLVALFDANSSTGKATKAVFESIFQPLIDGAAAMVPKIVSAFIQVQIWILKALIAIKPFGSTFETIGEIALVFGALFVSALVGVAAVIALVVVAAVGIVKTFKDIYDGALAIGNTASEGFTELYKRASEMYDYVSNLSLEEIGSMLVQGLADGITNAASSVIDAITGVADGALSAAKSVLQIASPSKAMFQIGAYTGEGMVGGLEATQGDVQDAMTSLASPTGGDGGDAGGGAKGSGMSLENVTFNFNGVAGAEDAEGRFRELLLAFLEGDLARLGLAVPNG